jgi:hypothetical protein
MTRSSEQARVEIAQVQAAYLQADFVGGCLLAGLGEGGVDVVKAPAGFGVVLFLEHARLNVEPHQLALQLIDDLKHQTTMSTVVVAH